MAGGNGAFPSVVVEELENKIADDSSPAKKMFMGFEQPKSVR
jgi:hypothetical protein